MGREVYWLEIMLICCYLFFSPYILTCTTFKKHLKSNLFVDCSTYSRESSRMDRRGDLATCIFIVCFHTLCHYLHSHIFSLSIIIHTCELLCRIMQVGGGGCQNFLKIQKVIMDLNTENLCFNVPVLQNAYNMDSPIR